jgi:nucleoside-diphosphate-sugar epimerase
LSYIKRLNHLSAPAIADPSILILGTEYLEDFSQLGSYIDIINRFINKDNILKIILLSSYAVYKPYQGLYSENTEKSPKTYSGCRSALLEDFFSYFYERYKIPVIVLRLFNIYGPLQPVPYLIPHILHSYVENDTISIGDVEKTRDFLYVEDFLGAIKSIVYKTFEEFSIFNLGSGNGINISQLINTLENIIGVKMRIIFDANKIREEYDYDYAVANISEICSKLEWKPKIPIEEGLALTYSWMLGRSATKCLQLDL